MYQRNSAEKLDYMIAKSLERFAGNNLPLIENIVRNQWYITTIQDSNNNLFTILSTDLKMPKDLTTYLKYAQEEYTYLASITKWYKC